MNDVTSGYVLLANALRPLIDTIRETRQRVLSSGASGASGVSRVAEAPTDDEAVHDFRVALRRCRTMLRVARSLWSTKQITRIEDELRYFARTTGTLRDDEVLRSILGSLLPAAGPNDEVREWLDRRARVGRTKRRTILRIVRKGPPLDAMTDEGKPVRPLDVVLDKLERLMELESAVTLSADELAHASVEKAVRAVRRAARGEVHDVRAMHVLRIREKRLRYTAELFANELGEQGRRLVTHATRMQRRLGDLHDFDEAIATVARARGLSKDTQHSVIATLRVGRAASAAKVEPQLIEARQLVTSLVLSSNESPPDAAA
jgi:CHAD domain-containing protein